MAGKKKKSGVFWMFLIFGIIGFIFILMTIFKGGNTKPKVTTEKVELRTIFSSVSESGVIEPVTEVKISPDVSGEIVELKIKEGDKVKRGDLLATIRPETYQAAMDQAQAAVNQATANMMNSKAGVAQAKANFLQDSANYFRNKQLLEKGAISKFEFENSELKYAISASQMEAAKQSTQAATFQIENAKATLRQASQNLQKTTIVASMDGIITRLNKKVGERVVGTATMEGTEILRIADLSRMQVKVEINENDIVHLTLGDTAMVKVEAFENKKFKGRVTEIAYSAAQSSVTASLDQVTNFEVKVEIDPSSYLNDSALMKNVSGQNSPFRPGLTAQVEIFTEMVQNITAVPIGAVTLSKSKKKQGINFGGQQGVKLKENENKEEDVHEIVYMLVGNRVKSVEVETGISDEKYIYIKSGLKVGDTVVTGPYTAISSTLKDSVEVVVNKTKKKENE